MSNYFMGNEVSAYGREHGWVDYATFAKSFQHVMNNDIVSKAWDLGYDWEPVNGPEDGDDPEVFQWYIVSEAGAEIISEYTEDPVFYCSGLDLHVWGVTHFGTGWDYVLTDIPLEPGY